MRRALGAGIVPAGAALLVLGALWLQRVEDARTPPPPPPIVAALAAEPPAPSLESDLRNPFETGAEWRAERRGRPPAPSPSATPALRPPAPPPEPPLLVGTLRKGQRMMVITADAIAGPGEKVGEWLVRAVESDGAVLEREGRVVRARVESRPAEAPPSPAPAHR